LSEKTRSAILTHIHTQKNVKRNQGETKKTHRNMYLKHRQQIQRKNSLLSGNKKLRKKHTATQSLSTNPTLALFTAFSSFGEMGIFYLLFFF